MSNYAWFDIWNNLFWGVMMNLYKIIAVMATLWALPSILSAELSPRTYTSWQSSAPHVVKVRTGRVSVRRLANGNMLVRCSARVLHRYRGFMSGKYMRWITIRYITRGRNPRGFLGPGPIPILRPHAVYKMYLKRDLRKGWYMPAAGNRSFVPVRAHH